MLLSGAIQKFKAQDDEKVKELREIAGRRWPSYQLLEILRGLGKRVPIIFGSSTFAFAETNHVILQEYIASRLHEKGVPFEFWDTLRHKEELEGDDEVDLYDQQNLLIATFFAWNKRILRWYDHSDFFSVRTLITSFRVSTTDAFLASQARRAKCTYFVTEDRNLRDLLAKWRGIEPISAEAMLGELKKAQFPLPRARGAKRIQRLA